MKWQEFLFGMIMSFFFTSIPANTGNGQDTVEVKTYTGPYIPVAIKRKIDSLEVKDATIDSLFEKIDQAPIVLEKATKEVKKSSKMLDDTDRRLDRIIYALTPKEIAKKQLRIARPITYKPLVPSSVTVPESKPVLLPEICPSEVKDKNLFRKIFYWVR